MSHHINSRSHRPIFGSLPPDRELLIIRLNQRQNTRPIPFHQNSTIDLACHGTDSSTLTLAPTSSFSFRTDTKLEPPPATSNTAMPSENEKANIQLTAGSGSGEPVVIGSSVPASANDSIRFFDFFGLPRELRDKIYEQPVLFEYEHLPTTSREDLITKAKKLRTSLLLVSRQFRDEYTERCAGQQALCMRDHCAFRGDIAVSPSPEGARIWAIEFFVMSGNTLNDLKMLKEFLDLQAGPDLTLRVVNIKLLFEDTRREMIEGGPVRSAISNIQDSGRVASLEIYLAKKLWDFRKSGKPKAPIARWDRSDDTHINFLTSAKKARNMGSEWGHPSDTDPDCCDPSKSDGSQTDSEIDGEDDNEGEGDDGVDEE